LNSQVGHLATWYSTNLKDEYGKVVEVRGVLHSKNCTKNRVAARARFVLHVGFEVDDLAGIAKDQS
jgi:hypothetical protein